MKILKTNTKKELGHTPMKMMTEAMMKRKMKKMMAVKMPPKPGKMISMTKPKVKKTKVIKY
jgi:hypothetical protein